MNKIVIAFVAAASLFMVGGCKKKGGGAAAEALGKIEGFSKAMCECKDKACGDKVNDEYTKWGTDMAKNAPAGKTDEKPDPELAKKMGEAVAKYGECFTKLAMAGAGGGSGMAGGGDGSAKEPDKGSGGGDMAGSDKKEEKKEEEKKDEKKDEK